MSSPADPADAALRLAAAHDDMFWLDGGGSGRSYLGTGARILPPRGEVLPTIRRELDAGATLIGWIGYEVREETTGVPAPHRSRFPDAALLRVDRVIAFDAVTGTAELVAAGESWSGGLAAWRDEMLDLLAAPSPERPAHPVATGPVRWRDDQASYLAKIERCLAAIRDGEAYQLCLTTTASIEGRFDPLAVALALRAATPSHHGGLVRIAGTSLVSASPERFLEVGADRVVRTRPIKGTRPRHPDPARDADLAAELVADAKEQAENLMIVDLMRNDLSRVCEVGSVAVTRLFDVESYPAVHQLVSEIEGRLAPGRDAVDALAACFPAGSMTGAPKLRATELLDELEQDARGVYSGAFGYLGPVGADLAMVIRSVVIDDAGAVVGAGGGITSSSDPDAEYAEMRLKAAALLAALGVREPGGSGPGDDGGPAEHRPAPAG